jgi:hypothetical protein
MRSRNEKGTRPDWVREEKMWETDQLQPRRPLSYKSMLPSVHDYSFLLPEMGAQLVWSCCLQVSLGITLYCRECHKTGGFQHNGQPHRTRLYAIVACGWLRERVALFTV